MRKEKIQYLPKPKTDSNGDVILPRPEPIDISGVVIWPRASEEKDGGEVNIDGQNLKCPDSANARLIRSDGQIMLRGELHTVDEPPARYIGKAILVKTKRVTT